LKSFDPVRHALEVAVDENPNLVRVVRVNVDVNEDAVAVANAASLLPAVHFWLGGERVGAIAGKSVIGLLGMSLQLL